MHDRPAQYISNHDGDTVTMMLDQGFYDRKQANLRLANTWAPELHDKGGTDVRAFVQDWFTIYQLPNETWDFIVITYVTKTGTDTMTFSRYVADVMTKDGKHHLNSDVMQYISDHGYGGGTGS